MKFQTQFLGKTGVVKIDEYGDRTEVDMVIKAVDEEKESSIILGTWSATSGLMWKEHNGPARRKSGLGNMVKQSLVITTVLVIIQKALFATCPDSRNDL